MIVSNFSEIIVFIANNDTLLLWWHDRDDRHIHA